MNKIWQSNNLYLRQQSQKGFTIIEIMIAITVFAIGILAINIMQTTSIKGNTVANTLTGQTNCGSNAIERLIATPYSNIVTDAVGYNSPDGAYKITWNVTEMNSQKTITVNVANNTPSTTQSYQIIYRKSKSI